MSGNRPGLVRLVHVLQAVWREQAQIDHEFRAFVGRRLQLIHGVSVVEKIVTSGICSAFYRQDSPHAMTNASARTRQLNFPPAASRDLLHFANPHPEW